MKTRIIVSVTLFAVSFALEKVAEKVFPFAEIVKMAIPKSA